MKSHDDPAVRRVSKPSLDPTYPAYIVGDADRISGTTRVAKVTGQRSEDLLRRLLTTVEAPALTLEVPAVETLLQRLVTETQSRPPPVVSPPAPTELEQSMRSLLAGQRRRQRPATATTVETPGPTPEVPAVEKLLQRLVTETQSRPPPIVSHPALTELEQLTRSFLTGQRGQLQ